MGVSEESLEIPVTYKGEKLLFQGELLMMGYTHKIQVEVENQLIMFEPDEEKNYRAILTPFSRHQERRGSDHSTTG